MLVVLAEECFAVATGRLRGSRAIFMKAGAVAFASATSCASESVELSTLIRSSACVSGTPIRFAIAAALRTWRSLIGFVLSVSSFA